MKRNNVQVTKKGTKQILKEDLNLEQKRRSLDFYQFITLLTRTKAHFQIRRIHC